MRSCYVGDAVSGLLKDEEITGIQMSMDLNISEQLISNIKHDRRTMHPDIAEESLKKYDNPFYLMKILHKFSNMCSPPVFSGKSVEHHRLAFEESMINEAKEAIEILEKVSFIKSPQYITEEERNLVKDAIDEILDVEAWAKNLIAILSSEYGISMKKCYLKRIAYWKSKGWMEK